MDDNGKEYWSSRDLCNAMGYSGAGGECVGRPHPNHQGGCGQEQNKGVK
jgi:hypothetical protein